MWQEQGFGAWLTQARKASGYPTVSALARATGYVEGEKGSGIAPSLISKWEADQAQPSVLNLRKLSAALHNVSMRHLLVAAGHLEAEELDMEGVPEPPPIPLDDELAATQAWMDNPAVPEEEKERARDYLRYLRGKGDHRATG